MEQCNFKRPLFAMTGVSLFLQLLGFVTPYWFVLTLPVATENFGLWYLVKCPKQNEDIGCTVESVSRNTNGEEHAALENGLLEYQIEATIALILCVLGTIFMLLVLRTDNELKVHRYMLAVLVCDLLSGICALVASSKMAENVRQAHVAMSMFTKSAFGFPYSLVLTGIGGLLLLSACIIYVFRKQCGPPSEQIDQSGRSYNTTPQSYPWTTSQPMSDGVSGQQYQPVPNEPQAYHEQELSPVENKDNNDPPPPYDQ